MVKWLPFVKTLVVLALLGVLFSIVARSWENLRFEQWRLGFFLLALLISLMLFPTSVASWYFVMRGLGVRFKLLRAAQIWLYANVARFIPGVVWQYGTRVVLAEQLENIPKLTTLLGMLYEMIFLLATAVLVIFAALPWWPTLKVSPWIGLVVIAGALVILSPPITSAAARVASKLMRRPIAIKNISFRYAVSAVSMNGAHFLLNGIVLTLLLGALGEPLRASYFLLLGGAYAFSWALGYLTLIAPGGVGVADITLAGILSTIVPPPVAALAALLMRVTLTASELFSVGVVSIFKR